MVPARVAVHDLAQEPVDNSWANFGAIAQTHVRMVETGFFDAVSVTKFVIDAPGVRWPLVRHIGSDTRLWMTPRAGKEILDRLTGIAREAVDRCPHEAPTLDLLPSDGRSTHKLPSEE
ncbi:hypothetical protein AFL01nite_02970 [Aeromicrobium flavum]|uniref:Uncharacterized protein n=1 Tax=Aeromicrobium flavum TaxID=416568 RepID=A0A512HRH5_9ACTN|nr:hypothetical protein AFL01nite_02970 [Aeromicrobium flavum]